MTRSSTRPTLVTSFVGERVVGMILARGITGWEAWTADEKSLGLFISAKDAHAAIVAEAQGSTS